MCVLCALASFKGDLHLWCRLLLPGVVKRVYNLQSKQLIKLFSKVRCDGAGIHCNWNLTLSLLDVILCICLQAFTGPKLTEILPGQQAHQLISKSNIAPLSQSWCEFWSHTLPVALPVSPYGVIFSVSSVWGQGWSCLCSVFSINLVLLTAMMDRVHKLNDPKRDILPLESCSFLILLLEILVFIIQCYLEHILFFCWFIFNVLSILDNVVSNGKMTEEWLIEKHLEVCGCGLIEAISWHLPVGSEENPKKDLSQASWIPRQYLNQASPAAASRSLPLHQCVQFINVNSLILGWVFKHLQSIKYGCTGCNVKSKLQMNTAGSFGSRPSQAVSSQSYAEATTRTWCG
jgi:hypothetical protein